MDSQEKTRFQSLYQRHVQALHLQGKRPATIDLYSRAVRRVSAHFDRCPDDLTQDELKSYFTALVQSHSWSTVRVDRFGLQFFWQHVLEKDWNWVRIVKPPRTSRIPDVLSVEEVVKVLGVVRKERYRTFFLTLYSMGLRLGEGLALRVSDIDSSRMLVHIRQGKGNKDRLVPLPEVTLEALRNFWKTHRNPALLFPNQNGSPETIRTATTPMDRGGVQEALKVALGEVGIAKRITVHSLRHSFATHLVEGKVHLRLIQDILGHASPLTTALYARLTEPSFQDRVKAIKTLMDRFRPGKG